ncbi:MAG: hypothetical protein JSV37_02830 [Anaerolineaceae bacterium]|nr:MAG: hypothetical protein JSV37_02830 [Anaerolineaceae bacterium]
MKRIFDKLRTAQLEVVRSSRKAILMLQRLEKLRYVWWGVIWGVIILVATLASGCNTFSEPEMPSPTLSPSQELTPGSFTAEGWNTFINDAYHYAFDYPNSAIVEVMDKSTETIRIQTSGNDLFLLYALVDYLTGDVTYFLDTAPIGQRQIGDFIWLEYFLPDGYCDGPDCSPPIYGLQMEHGDTLYRVMIYSQESTTEIQDVILATFRIIP